MKMAQGFHHWHPGKVCQLQKSLYGLKQAPCCWFIKLCNSLLKFRLSDLLICGKNNYMQQKFKNYLKHCLSVKDSEKLKYLFARSGSWFRRNFLSLKIIYEIRNLGCKPAATPLEQGHQIATKSPLLADSKQYRCLDRQLKYLNHPRPELRYAIHILIQLCRVQKKPIWMQQTAWFET